MNIPVPFGKLLMSAVCAALCALTHTALAYTVPGSTTTSGSSLSVSSPTQANIDSFIFNTAGAVLVLDDVRTYSVGSVQIRGPLTGDVAALYVHGSTLASNTYIALGQNANTRGHMEITSGTVSATSTLGIATGSGSQGTLIMSGGVMTIASSIAIATSSASTGALNLSGGALTAASLTLAGGASNSSGTVTVSGGSLLLGNLSFAAGSGASTGVLSVEGGAVTVSGTTTLAKNGTGRLQVTSGSFHTGALSMGNEGKTSYLTVSNKAAFSVGSTLNAGSGAVITLQLQGSAFTAGDAVIDASTAAVSLAADTVIRIDMTDYDAAQTQTITLMSYASKPTETTISVIGSYDENRYEVQSAVWGTNALTVTINYIPEPAMAAALLGALGLGSLLRRRRS